MTASLQSCHYCGKSAWINPDDETSVLVFLAQGFSSSGARPDLYSCRVPCAPQMQAAARRAALERQRPGWRWR